MLQTILAFWGYVKIPKDAIYLSMRLENLLKEAVDMAALSDEAENLKNYHQSAKALTAFLRAGRLISYSK